MTGWNYLQAEMVGQDGMLRPMIGEGGFTRAEALAKIQGILDRADILAPVAALWRAGAQDDTVFHWPFVWAVYEHPAGENPQRAAIAWLEDFAVGMRRTGLDVQVARPPR